MRLGFIGCGNMATAIIGGILQSGNIDRENILASVKSESSAQRVTNLLGIKCTTDNIKVAQFADYLFLTVKPQMSVEVIAEIKDHLNEQQVIVSVMAGKKLSWLKEKFNKGQKIIRVMPNTAALVAQSMTGVCADESSAEAEIKQVIEFMSCVGEVDILSENQLDILSAVSGSSPAFVFMFIEALADGAVAEGMPRNKAYTCATQALLGSAKLLQDTNRHPGELKDMVCSPGGSTIEGLNVLEQHAMRAAVMDAVRACIKKTQEI